MCEITNSLKAILDPDNPDDRKLLLLAQLIESMKSGIEKREFSMIQDINDLKNKVDSLSLETKSCPIIHGNQNQFLNFFFTYPKIAIIFLLILGVILGAIIPDVGDYILKFLKLL